MLSSHMRLMTTALGSRALNNENREKQFPAVEAVSPGRHCGREVGFSAGEIDEVVIATC